MHHFWGKDPLQRYYVFFGLGLVLCVRGKLHQLCAVALFSNCAHLENKATKR